MNNSTDRGPAALSTRDHFEVEVDAKRIPGNLALIADRFAKDCERARQVHDEFHFDEEAAIAFKPGELIGGEIAADASLALRHIQDRTSHLYEVLVAAIIMREPMAELADIGTSISVSDKLAAAVGRARLIDALILAGEAYVDMRQPQETKWSTPSLRRTRRSWEPPMAANDNVLKIGDAIFAGTRFRPDWRDVA